MGAGRGGQSKYFRSKLNQKDSSERRIHVFKKRKQTERNVHVFIKRKQILHEPDVRIVPPLHFNTAYRSKKRC